MPNIATRFLDFCKRFCAQCTRPVVLVHGPHVNHEIDDLKHFPFCNVQHLNMRTKAQFQFSLSANNKPTHTKGTNKDLPHASVYCQWGVLPAK